MSITSRDGRCNLPPNASSLLDEAPLLRSVHIGNSSAILQELGDSVLVTTYQAGKLVMLRPDGDRINTHFETPELVPDPLRRTVNKNKVA